MEIWTLLLMAPYVPAMIPLFILFTSVTVLMACLSFPSM